MLEVESRFKLKLGDSRAHGSHHWTIDLQRVLDWGCIMKSFVKLSEYGELYAKRQGDDQISSMMYTLEKDKIRANRRAAAIV